MVSNASGASALSGSGLVISYIRATYGDTKHTHIPNQRLQCGTDPVPFTAGPFDAVTVYCLDIAHEALLCPEVKKWRDHLHNKVRPRVIQIITAAVPEEEVLPRSGQSGQPVPSESGLWRLNLTEECGRALETKGWLIKAGTPCGPWTTSDEVRSYGRTVAHRLQQERLAPAAGRFPP